MLYDLITNTGRIITSLQSRAVWAWLLVSASVSVLWADGKPTWSGLFIAHEGSPNNNLRRLTLFPQCYGGAHGPFGEIPCCITRARPHAQRVLHPDPASNLDDVKPGLMTSERPSHLHEKFWRSGWSPDPRGYSVTSVFRD
ncbi:hypothetical protein HBI70_184920 [Parastagonospora nodorum]|nr:hypothetical protein HBI73_131920 [Parastagonospora nodorum]KAH5256200.1 hypothetical protein HBI70_184920 [Parastagonospora nodorum]KAH5408073.1 hypothetical protein HBI46_184040 [Parastagonospora nodorum]KAH5596403.1 hypothetical protein HBI45_179620 [Parastagonospora nodorum]KAH5669414.1 hypothetical protein HBI21_198850 [Parastagonospora nodorum]